MWTDIYAAYSAIFADPKLIEDAADQFSDDEYIQLVRRVAKIHPSILQHLAYDRIKLEALIAELVEVVPYMHLGHIPFDHVSEDFYVRIGERLIENNWGMRVEIPTKLSMAAYTKLVNCAVHANRFSFGMYDAKLIEPAVYEELKEFVGPRVASAPPIGSTAIQSGFQDMNADARETTLLERTVQLLLKALPEVCGQVGADPIYVQLATAACEDSAKSLAIVDILPSEIYEQCAQKAVNENVSNIRFVKYPPCRAEAYERFLKQLDEASL